MISVIMPCWINNEETLEKTKNAIHSLGEVFLIIVDNGSSIGGGYMRDIANLYIRNSSNLGYAKAVNQGLSLAKTELITIANNDIRISPNWQEIVKEVFITPQVYSCHFRMTDYDVPFAYGEKIAYSGKERWCTTSFYVLNTAKVKFFFDEHFLNSYDDWDYWRTVRLSKFRTAYTDKACYQHHHSFSQKQVPEREENDKRNREYFKEKWGEYAEDLFAREYPDQMRFDYWEGFKI